MHQTDIPARFPIPFANNAGAGYIRTIPQAHQAATTSDAPASLYDGFPVECFTPQASGGIPPNGKDFNGILKWLSQQAQWNQAGAPAIFDSAFATAVGGYPLNAVLGSAVTAGKMYVSLIDANTSDPDTGSTSWGTIAPPTFTASGTSWKRISPDGFIEMGDVAPNPSFREGSVSLTFPFGGFPTAFLGMETMTLNITASNNGATLYQEVSSSKTSITLYKQSDASSGGDVLGGFRWRAWGY